MHKPPTPRPGFLLRFVLLCLALGGTAEAVFFYSFLPSNGAGDAIFNPPRSIDPSDVAVPPGYCIEPMAAGLTYPTSVATDDHDRVYVLESGYSYGEDFTRPRLLRLERDGSISTIAAGDETDGPWTGMSYSDGVFYVSDGGAARGGGRILRISLGGDIETLVDGLPSMGDHHTNKPVVGTDGYLYFGVGTATNSGVVGPDNAKFGWLKRTPDLHDIPPVDIVLRGRNYVSRNALDPASGQRVVTGAFVPYGTRTQPGQVIPGRLPCTGAILRTPVNGNGELEWVAWGFRNPFGLAFAPDGSLFCTDNLYDERGCRPVYGAGDLLWKVNSGLWYGFPDYYGNIPLTHPRFSEKKDQNPPGFLLAHHPNVPPEPAAWLGVRSSSDGLDFSRNPCFGHCGEAFVAVFGDIVACGDGKVRRPVGCRVVRVDPCSGTIEDFVINKGKEAGPASKEGHCGIERPVDVRFSNDGSELYVVDFGVMTTLERHKPTPYRGTGVLWRVRRTHPDRCDEVATTDPGHNGYYRRGEAIGRPIELTTSAQERGQRVYMKHCYACHQGGEGGLGPALLQLAPDPIVRLQIRTGLGAMPGFSHEEISFDEMNDLMSYIRRSRHSGPPYRPLR